MITRLLCMSEGLSAYMCSTNWQCLLPAIRCERNYLSFLRMVRLPDHANSTSLLQLRHGRRDRYISFPIGRKASTINWWTKLGRTNRPTAARELGLILHFSWLWLCISHLYCSPSVYSGFGQEVRNLRAGKAAASRECRWSILAWRKTNQFGAIAPRIIRRAPEVDGEVDLHVGC